jgi:hypothetical protein
MNYLKINRERLAKFLPDEQTIKTFEELIKIINLDKVIDSIYSDYSDYAVIAGLANVATLAETIDFGAILPIGADDGTIKWAFDYLHVKTPYGWWRTYISDPGHLVRRPIRGYASITAASAGTAVHVIPDSQVGPSETIAISQMIIRVNGATAWTDATATVVKIQNSDGSILGVTIPKALLTGFATIWLSTPGLTLSATVVANGGPGFGNGKGLDVVADANFAAGSNILVTLIGDILVSTS